MIENGRILFAILVALLVYPGDNLGGAFQPEFTSVLQNLTVPLGRDAVFTCHVEHLGGYRVGWVKADTKAIQAIHDHVITHNERVSVSHSDHSTWSLRIKGVKKEDAGTYMCQINTNPMKSQTGVLLVQVPPDFIPEETSDDVTVPEGMQVKLVCRATGDPQPRVTWRREDLRDIIIHEPLPRKSTNSNQKAIRRVHEWPEEELVLTKISRQQMGSYMCIASNSVPPSISKRIIVDVHFPPTIHVPNQLVGAPLGTDVTLECDVEASPQSINFWLKDTNKDKGVMIVSNGRHEVQLISRSSNSLSRGGGGGSHVTLGSHNFKVKMLLTIKNFTQADVGNYRCSAKNSRGDYEGSIRLYEISGPLKSQSAGETVYSSPDQDGPHYSNGNQDGSYGSDYDRTQNRPSYLDNSVQGQAGAPQISRPSSGTSLRKRVNHKNMAQSSADRKALLIPLMIVTILQLILSCNLRIGR